jgi:hypothetical protein
VYKPLFKALAKDLLAQCSSKHIVVTLANVGKHKLKDKTAVLPLTFQKSTTGAGISATAGSQAMTPWLAYRAALMLVMPLLEHEEAFVAVSVLVWCSVRCTVEILVIASTSVKLPPLYEYICVIYFLLFSLVFCQYRRF